jgi:hypothetical protein
MKIYWKTCAQTGSHLFAHFNYFAQKVGFESCCCKKIKFIRSEKFFDKNMTRKFLLLKAAIFICQTLTENNNFLGPHLLCLTEFHFAHILFLHFCRAKLNHRTLTPPPQKNGWEANPGS